MVRARIGLTVAVGLRLALVGMLLAVIRAEPGDRRFAGKGIVTRFTVFAMPATMLVPVVWLGRRLRERAIPMAGSAPRPAGARLPTDAVNPADGPRHGDGAMDPPYPAWTDALYVSLFALDLAGNVLDLYDRHAHFDLIPHAHGGGAIAVTGASLFGWSPARAVAASIAGHALLEAQEIASDAVFGLRNVRGWWDVAGDLAAGVAGAAAYAAAYRRVVRSTGGPEPAPPPELLGGVPRALS